MAVDAHCNMKNVFTYDATLAQSFKAPFLIAQVDSSNPHHCIVHEHMQSWGQDC